ncbi:MAG: tyrosine-protein phosphatase [Stackebrandtia sp.]
MSSAHDDRFVPLERVFNLRDLGGLTGHGDREVRSGLVFRSDQFGNATDSDITHIREELGVRTVVDLRRPEEIAQTGSFPAENGLSVRHLELKHIMWERFADRDVAAEPSSVRFLTERYTAMLETGHEAIRDTLGLMCDATPMVFHCMAGKDRTGIIAAVALGLLGVEQDDIVSDYALTTQGMARFWAWRSPETPPQGWGFTAEADAMRGLLRNIDAYYGGVEAYARVIQFDGVDALRRRMLG